MNKLTKLITEKSGRVAIPVMTHPGIEALGYTVKDAVTSGKIHYEAIRYLSENSDSDACTAIMDLTVEAEAFGAEISMPDDEVPSVMGRLVSDENSVNALPIPDMSAGRIQEYLLANKMAAENIHSKPVFSGCIGPFSLAGRLYDMSEIMVAIYIDPDIITALLNKCTKFLIDYSKALKLSGTDGVVIAEPAAGLLSNDDCMMYSTEFVKKIVDAVQDDNFSVILHNCGNNGQCTNAMLESGAHALHFGNAIDMVAAIEACPPEIVAMGNLDPVGVFKQKTAEEVYSITSTLLEKTKNYSNFVISSGCDLPPHVPAANINAYFKAVKDFNSK